ncbi:MAG TPA: DPP IV N-terminal domain-containing protein [Flavipsychrobacter sp.]|nr:DPP IV N-terminal domain-containing protein [Flavipsychrobacter sp.]
MLTDKKICLLLAGCILYFQSFSQRKQFTITEATNGLATTLAPQNIKKPSWDPGTDRFFQVIKAGNSEALIATNYPNDKTDTILRLQQLNNAVKGNFKSIPTINWLGRDEAYVTNEQSLEKGVLAVDGFHWSHWMTLPDSAANITVDKSKKIAYTTANNLWLVTPDKRTIQVTNEHDKNIICGQSVHREEFGITKGIFFSPEGNYLAYYRMDQTMVNDYPIIDWDTVPATPNMIKYPMAGGTSHQVTLCVYNPTTGKTVTMETGEPKDHYLTCVTWAPDEKSVFIAILNRDQNHLWLNQYDIQTGKKIKTLFEETDPKYVQPLHPLSFVPGSDNKFIWWSQKDGYMHLYLYNTNGKLLRKLTNGKWVVNEIIGFNEDRDQVIITSAKESPLEKHSYTVNLNNGKMNRIDKERGMHYLISSEDGKFVFDMFSSTGVPRKCIVRSTSGKYLKTLLVASDPLANYDRPTIKNITIKADDGTPLHGKLILPTNFDSTKKYPVIVYLYNGPNIQLIHNSFPESGNLWFEYMAQRGYVVFTMDGRGSSNRGLAFEQITFRRLGTIEMEDQLKGVDYLKSLPYVDSTRMGVHGWSFGGFMTTSLMLRHPGVFKCAVAGGPVIDWKMYEVMYTERYMDTPQDNPKGYEDANLLTKVKNLKGKLLLIHGTSDPVVVWQQSLRFIKKCVDNNVQIDYFVYPGHEHNVLGKDRVHLMQKISDYFDLYLKSDNKQQTNLQ